MNNTAPSPLDPRSQRFATALADWPRRKVTLLELWRVLDTADPASRMTGARRQTLLDILNTLANAGLIELAAAPSWDRTEKPHLPRFVRLPSPDPTPYARHDVVWHPSLAWVPETRLSATHRADLAKINRWLHIDRSDLVVPLRERSLEIFGQEKTLDRLLRSNLFAPDRLTLQLLRTRRTAPLFTHQLVGPGATLLVAENSDTYDSLTRALERDPGPIGIVGWGSGGGFEASILSVPQLRQPIERIVYFGDLDLRGLQIPASADRTAKAAGLPPVQPATGLYEALFEQGTRQASKSISPSNAHDAVQWLPSHLQERTAQLLTNGGRLAQEHVGLGYLTSESAWRPT